MKNQPAPRRIWSLVVSLAFLAAWLGCPAPAFPAEPSTPSPFGPKERVLDVGIQPLWVPTAAITEVMRRDLTLRRQMTALGKEVRFHPFRLGPEGNRQLAPQGLDAMLAGDLPAVAAAAVKEVVIVTLVHQGFAAIVAKGVGSVAGLRGKRVAYAPGSSTHYTLFRVLGQHGIDPRQVTLIPHPDLNAWVEDLRSGKIQALSAWDPLTTVVSKTVPGATVLQRSLFEGYLYFTRQAMTRDPQAARLVIAAQIRAMEWMRTSRDNLHAACRWALAEHARFGGAPAQVTLAEYAALVRSALLDVAPIPEVDFEQLRQGGAIQAKLDFLIQQGTVPPDTPFARIRDSFDRGLVAEVMAAPIRYGLGEFAYDESER